MCKTSERDRIANAIIRATKDRCYWEWKRKHFWDDPMEVINLKTGKKITEEEFEAYKKYKREQYGVYYE